jgi:hypothetical protein
MALDGLLKKLMCGSLLFLAPLCHSQIPVLPEFNRIGKPELPELPLVKTKGAVVWRCSYYERNNSPANKKWVMHGLADVDLSISIFYSTHLSFGVITEVEDSVVESIVYSLGEDERDVNAYKKALAESKGINAAELSSLYHSRLDYRKMKIYFPEKDSSATLPKGAMELQTTFASLLQNPPASDTTRSVWYKGEIWPIKTSVTKTDSGYIVIGDLRKPDPKDSTKLVRIFPFIDNVSISTKDIIFIRDGLSVKATIPYEVKAEGKFIYPITGKAKLTDR